MATIYDVAKRANVSTGTVSRYLNENGYVGEQTRARIELAINELQFTPSSVARSLTTKRTRMLGFVVSDLNNPFVPEVARGLQDLADEQGYCVLIFNTDGDGQREARALNLLRDRQVDGLVITPPETPQGDACIRELHAQGIPIVFLGRKVDGVAIDRVTTDTYAGGRAAMEHLLELGHTRIALIGGDEQRNATTGRRKAYGDSLAQARLPIDPALIAATPLFRAGGAAAAAALLALPNRPSAIFAVNDTLALGVLTEATRRGLRVPRDLSVVGFDDIALAEQAHPPLTTVAQPKLQLGRTAARLLIARIERQTAAEPQEARLPCELVPRASTGPVPGPRRGSRVGNGRQSTGR